MEESISYTTTVYLPEKQYDTGISKAFHFHHLRETLRPSIQAMVLPKKSNAVVVNIPGYNSDLQGYDSVYLQMAERITTHYNSAVVLSDNRQLKGYDNSKILVEKGRALINYVLDNAEHITGSTNPRIFLVGTSAGGSCCAAISNEFPLVKKIILINPSGDIPESVMRDSFSKFTGDIFIANGRCDFNIGPQSGRYLGNFAKSYRSIRYIYLPNTGHSFNSTYSKLLVISLPYLFFTSHYKYFPKITMRYLYHSLIQIPQIMKKNALQTLSTNIEASFGFIIDRITENISYIKSLSTFCSDVKLKQNCSFRKGLHYHNKIFKRHDYIEKLHMYSKNYNHTVFLCLMKGLCFISRKEVLLRYVESVSEFQEKHLSKFENVRTKSFLSVVFEHLSQTDGIIELLLTDKSANHFLRFCSFIDKTQFNDIESSLRNFTIYIDTLYEELLSDQRFWKIIYSLFFHHHNENSMNSLFTLLLHQNTTNLQNDYLWLLIDYILMHNSKPRSTFIGCLQLSKNYKREISKQILTAVHIATDDMENLIRLIQKIHKNVFLHIIDNELFLEQILIISKIKNVYNRTFFYNLISVFYSAINEETDIQQYLSEMHVTFSAIQSRIQYHDNNFAYNLIIEYIKHIDIEKLHIISFWDTLACDTDSFIKKVIAYSTQPEEIVSYISYLPQHLYDTTKFFSYFDYYFTAFNKEGHHIINYLADLHPYLFFHFNDIRFPLLIQLLKNIAYSMTIDDSEYIEMVLSFPDIILRFLSMKIYRCTYSDINEGLKKINLSIVPLTVFNIQSMFKLISIPISFENKSKLLVFLAYSEQIIEISDNEIKECFDSLEIEEIFTLLKIKFPDTIISNSGQKRIFRFAIESVINKEMSANHDPIIIELIHKFSLDFDDSFIIKKFLKRIVIEKENTKNIPAIIIDIISNIVKVYEKKKAESLIQFVGVEHVKNVILYLSSVKENLHTSKGFPYFMPEKRGDSYYGFWRVVHPAALENYIRYGHEIQKSKSKYTYIGLHRDECFSLPDVDGFMVWMPSYVYKKFLLNGYILVDIREKSKNEIVINEDVSFDDLKVYFIHFDLYESNTELFSKCAVLHFFNFSCIYYSTFVSSPVRYSLITDRYSIKYIIQSHQKENTKRLIIVYRGTNNLKQLKRFFKSSIINHCFPQFTYKEINTASLRHYLNTHFKDNNINLLSLYISNTYRRGRPKIRKIYRRGFNDGFLVSIKGKKYYGKSYENPDRINAEYLSWLIYYEAGSQVKKDVRILTIDKRYMLLGEWLTAPLFKSQHVSVESRALDFVLSCLIQDRDQGKPDNYLYVNKSLLPFDFGGSFMFRSTGGFKGDDGQTPFGINNFKEMLKTDSYHFRKELYRDLRFTPRMIESAMFTVIRKITPEVIDILLQSVPFSDSVIKDKISLVLHQSRNYLLNRLAFFSHRQLHIDEIPAELESVFDLLSIQYETKYICVELDRRFSFAESVRHLLPSIEVVEHVMNNERFDEVFPGYQSRILSVGRCVRIITSDRHNIELSSRETTTLLSRLGAGTYEIALITFLLQHPEFTDNIMAICNKNAQSYFDKAESLHKYIISTLSESFKSTEIQPDIFIHDLLSACLYFFSNDNESEEYKVLERYRYNLSENLFYNIVDI